MRRNRRTEDALWQQVDATLELLSEAHDAIVLYGTSIVDHGVGAAYTLDLYQTSRELVQAAAQFVETMDRSAVPTVWVGEQVIALSLLTTTIKYSPLATAEDETFLLAAMTACDERYRHNLLILEALRQSEMQAIEVTGLLKRETHPGSTVDVNQLSEEVLEVTTWIVEALSSERGIRPDDPTE